MKKLITAVAFCFFAAMSFSQGSKTCDDNTIEWGKLEFLEKKAASSSSVIDKYTYYEVTDTYFTLYEFELYNGDTTGINYYRIDFTSLGKTAVLVNESDAGNRSGQPFEYGFMSTDFSTAHIEFGKFSCSSIWGRKYTKTAEKAIYMAFQTAEVRNKVKEIVSAHITKI